MSSKFSEILFQGTNREPAKSSAFIHKSDNLSSIPGSHSERREPEHSIFLCHMYIMAHTHTHTHTCGGSNDNAPHRFVCLNIWFPVGRTLWGGLGGEALEKVCHWWLGSEVSKRLMAFQWLSASAAFRSRYELSAAADSMPLLCHHGH